MADHDAITTTAPHRASRADHPDAAIFAAVRAIEEADAAVARAAARADRMAAGAEGRIVERGDLDALDAANDSYAAGLEALASCTPCTAAGVRTVLGALAAIDPPEADWLPAALARLAGCPALADGVNGL